METLDYILNKYNGGFVKKTNPIIHLPIGRFRDIPRLFTELGFTKGAEIGVYRGHYTQNLLRRIPNLELIGVDLWDVYPGYKDFELTDIKKAELEARELTKGYNCQLIKGWSDVVVKDIPDESLDFVFIDGNHSYEWCVWDIANWSKKVRKGGIVYGHDYDDYSHTRKYKEMSVINAVDGWVKSNKIEPLFITVNNKNRCWMYVK